MRCNKKLILAMCIALTAVFTASPRMQAQAPTPQTGGTLDSVTALRVDARPHCRST